MSGGSYDYLYSKVMDAADRIGGTPARLAFSKHLALVAKALHDIEWVDSCDYGPGDEDEAIRAVLAPGAEVEAAVEQAEKVLTALAEAIKSAKDRP